MRRLATILMLLVSASGCDGPPQTQGARPKTRTGAGGAASLTEARRGFATRLVARPAENEPAPAPPAGVFDLVRFDAPVGKLAAYLTPDPDDGRRHPAIVWITGGDCNSIGDVWSPGRPENDQTAAAYRRAGIVMMFPSLRGGNDNPGRREGFLGEVDDVSAAVDFLAKRPYVDPARIYLGGHSTGGTLVMLAAMSTDRLRAVFSFGPVDDVSGYPDDYLPFDTTNPREIQLRSPIRWLGSVRSPLFVFEGTVEPANLGSLQQMAAASQNPRIQFREVRGATHFSILAPVNQLLAEKVLADDGPSTRITITPQELEALGR